MKLRLVTLSEDRVIAPGLIGQQGLSILVESNGVSILLDTGQGISTVHNADVLGIDLGKLDRIVLSHGHYDHTGGLHNVLGRIRKNDMEIIAHPDIWESKYVRDRFVGIPHQREELERLGAKFRLTKQPIKIADNISTTGEIPMVTEFEGLSSKMLVKEGTKWKPDKMLDDQALIINTNRGLIVILGCAHRGAVNTIYHAQKLTGENQIYMVLGGCHLNSPDSDPQIEATINVLKELDVQKVAVSHCTGMPASIRMAQAFGDRFLFNNAGTMITID
jgi:7,8-dihydropterin-6-yl-methyl-4-(beta-D-ribofuranosyl)aminobenzene 5'-phosphate synthase